ncbi:MAG: hypothetical protein ACWA5U_09670 [bacterium]
MLRLSVFSLLLFMLINLSPLIAVAKDHTQLTLSPIIQEKITRFYSEYDKKRQCWVAKDQYDSNLHYCLKIEKIKVIKTDQGKRHYILLSGEILDEQQESASSHASSGLVAAFIFQENQLIAHNAYYPLGSFGKPPEGWSMIKLSENDYWAWFNTWGDCHFGHCGGRYVLLAPYEKSIKNIADFTSDYSDSGTGKFENGGGTELESTLIVDTTQQAEKNTGIYPLKINIKGLNAGKAVQKTEWIIPFNRKKWGYIEPRNWPLANREF